MSLANYTDAQLFAELAGRERVRTSLLQSRGTMCRALAAVSETWMVRPAAIAALGRTQPTALARHMSWLLCRRSGMRVSEIAAAAVWPDWATIRHGISTAEAAVQTSPEEAARLTRAEELFRHAYPSLPVAAAS